MEGRLGQPPSGIPAAQLASELYCVNGQRKSTLAQPVCDKASSSTWSLELSWNTSELGNSRLQLSVKCFLGCVSVWRKACVLHPHPPGHCTRERGKTGRVCTQFLMQRAGHRIPAGNQGSPGCPLVLVMGWGITACFSCQSL